jgi:transposase
VQGTPHAYAQGCGPQLPPRPLAYMPELGAFSKGEAASIAGLAPINKDSGKYHGPRARASLHSLHPLHGRTNRHQALMRLFAKRLQENGKPSKLVITSVMRKLIVTLNAILRSGEPWPHAEMA